MSKLERAWWVQHKVQDFASLVPTKKQTEVGIELHSGDIFVLQYSSMSRSKTYRRGRIMLTERDEDSLVGTVVVKYYLLQNLPLADRAKYKGVIRKMIRVAMQRLVLLVPLGGISKLDGNL